MARMDELWKAVGGPGTPPAADSRAVKARVNAALDADRNERRMYMRQKLRIAIGAVAAAIAVTGSALAVTNNWDMIQVFFKGDTAPAQEYVDSTARSVSDENYTLTMDGSMADENTIYLIATFTANSPEAREFLLSDDFYGMDTFDIHSMEQVQADSSDLDESIPRVTSLGLGEMDAPDENSRRFRLTVRVTQPVSALLVGSGYMETTVEVPVTPAPSVTVELGVSGVGTPVTDTPVPGTLTVERVVLSPFTCQIECADVPITDGYLTYPRLFFRMADGSIRTQSQMMERTSFTSDSDSEWSDGVIDYSRCLFNYQFVAVQDLESIVSVIAFDVEYPLDGSEPVQLEHDPALDPFSLPLMEPLTETSGFSLPVRALTEMLGGTCAWDPVTGNVTCTYRDVTVVLHPGDATARVDGQPVTLRDAPAIQDGSLAATYSLFADAWGIGGFAARTYSYIGDEVEITWGDWYIIP